MKCFKFSFSETPKTTTKSISRPSSSELNHQNVADFSIESTRSTNVPSISQKSNNLRVFTFSELKTATNKFSRSNMIGEGGFGSVYMGVIKNPKDSTKRLDVVVKRLEITYSRGHKEWVTEVNMLGVVEHPNLVKLVGYCAEDDERGIQRLLVYEFMPNRSVEDHLSRRSKAPLSWTMRLKVAQDAARGLAYLHEEMELQIIFQEFKSSDVLLDEKWNAKLSDFGMARSEPQVRLTPLAATVMAPMGTAAPEYIQTGYMSSKSDVWGYGVVLYELITGRRPLDRNLPIRESNLIEWVKSYDIRSNKFQRIIDPRLEGTCSLKSARRLATIANLCLNKNPKLRPKMSEVLKRVNKLIEVSIAEKTQEDTTHEGERGSNDILPMEPFKVHEIVV